MKKKQHNLQKDVIIEWSRDKRHLNHKGALSNFVPEKRIRVH